MSEREVKSIIVDPPKRGPGGHAMMWMAYYAGDDLEPGSPRGWGGTQFEAEKDLKKMGAP